SAVKARRTLPSASPSLTSATPAFSTMVSRIARQVSIWLRSAVQPSSRASKVVTRSRRGSIAHQYEARPPRSHSRFRPRGMRAGDRESLYRSTDVAAQPICGSVDAAAGGAQLLERDLAVMIGIGRGKAGAAASDELLLDELAVTVAVEALEHRL